ncbi:hypothetical protein F2P81_021089 [Scophthalmus maximus]|uniref:Uncharacterized protein n=1 Tax=Scophthalmus maximus TaxID=52904 RepID=A0A6A4S4V5_SCOMX|nr:hypothetical protein F2P81_021089 [Scophthalmus maximus]
MSSKTRSSLMPSSIFLISGIGVVLLLGSKRRAREIKMDSRYDRHKAGSKPNLQHIAVLFPSNNNNCIR